MPGGHEFDTRKELRRSSRFTGNLGFWGTESCNAHTGLSSKGDLSCRFFAVHKTLDLSSCGIAWHLALRLILHAR